MSIVLFTLVAVVLYLAADRILDLLERRAGRRFDNRSLIFLALLMAMSLVTFALIRHLAAPA